MSSGDDFEKDAAQLEAGEALASPTSKSSPTLTNSSTRSSWLRKDSVSSLWTRIWSPSNTNQSKEVTLESENANGLGIDQSATGSPPEPSQLPLKVRSLQRFPTGYPQLAAFADSDESYMVYRRFGYLQSRILLEKQDELRRLEERLDALDDEDINNPDNLEIRDLQGQQRRELLADIEKTYCEYGNVVGAAQQFMNAQRPTRSEHKSILNFIDNQPVHPSEYDYLYWKEDLFSLRPGREMAWLDRGIERMLKWMHCDIVEKIFGNRETSLKSSSDLHIYYSRLRISTFASSIITIVILFLLIIPIYLLYHLVMSSKGALSARSTGLCIGILLVFTLVFSAVMSFFTRAKRHEIFAAAAAYCAVLVVFMGNVGND